MAAYRKKCKRLHEPGDAHCLTFSCFQRRPFLSKDRSRQWMVDAIEKARDAHELHLWAYVIMPEHVHLLLWTPRPTFDTSSVLSTLKQSVSKRALCYVRENAPEFLPQMADYAGNGEVSYRFWQRGGGYDRNLNNPAAIFREIDYIHANPVRRGLCIRSIDWIWSSAVEYEETGKGLLRVDKESLPRTLQG